MAFRTTKINEKDSIKKAKELIKDKKYNTAYKLLVSIDPDNTDPKVVLLREDIVLEYFVQSIMHQMFALRDLNPGETIEDYRGGNGTNDMYAFEVDKVLKYLIKQYPKEYDLYEGLADFYESVNEHYGGKWLISGDSLNDLIRDNYQVAIDHNVANANAYFRVAIYMLQDDKAYRKAINYLSKAYKIDSSNADYSYNLAYAYLYCDSRDTALKYALTSEDKYKDPSMKGDAERMIGEIYIEMKDTGNSIKYYEKANKTDPDNYYTLRSLLSVYVAANNLKRKEVIDTFFVLDPKNPTIYNDLYDMYSDSIKGLELVAFFKSKVATYTDQAKVLGSLYFYLARLSLDYNKPAAKDYALKAKDAFLKIFDKNNSVFAQIDKLIAIADGKDNDKGN